MNAEFHTTRTELANEFAEAGSELLAYMGTDAALAAIPSTDQYVVAGTLQMIAKVLPAAPPASAAEQPSVLMDERVAFEEWARRTHRRPGTSFDRAHNGTYKDNRIAAKWAAWQACVAAHLARQSPAPEKAEPVAWLEAEPSARGQDPRNVAWSMLYSTRIHTKCAPMTSNPVWPLYAAPVAQEVEPGSAPAAADEARTDAVRDVLAERRRQVEAEGWHPDQDDDYEDGQLSMAAACYAMQGNKPNYGAPDNWPWERDWWKPTTDRRNLVKAGALILADIERLDRAAPSSTQHSAKAGGLTPHGADIERMLDAAEQDQGAKAGAERGGE